MKTVKEKKRSFVAGNLTDKGGKSGEIIAAINGDSRCKGEESNQARVLIKRLHVRQWRTN